MNTNKILRDYTLSTDKKNTRIQARVRFLRTRLYIASRFYGFQKSVPPGFRLALQTPGNTFFWQLSPLTPHRLILDGGGRNGDQCVAVVVVVVGVLVTERWYESIASCIGG